MQISLRKATAADVPSILNLIRELATYERAPNEVEATEASMIKDGFGDQPLFDAMVAEADGVVCGVAIFYTCYSTWKGRMVYLDDLIVTESKRNLGIGKKLFDAVAAHTRNTGANLLRWHVLDWNAPAIDFYNSYDASFDASWITCKLTRSQLDKL